MCQNIPRGSTTFVLGHLKGSHVYGETGYSHFGSTNRLTQHCVRGFYVEADQLMYLYLSMYICMCYKSKGGVLQHFQSVCITVSVRLYLR